MTRWRTRILHQLLLTYLSLGLYFHPPRHACCPVAAKVIPDDLFTWDGTIESDDREESQAKDKDHD